MRNLKLGIRFANNDYYLTMRGILMTLFIASEMGTLNAREFLKNKQHVQLIINQLSYGCYLAFQNPFIHGEEARNNSYAPDRSSYLDIPPEDIFIGDEVPELLNSADFEYDGEFFVIDFRTTDFDCH